MILDWALKNAESLPHGEGAMAHLLERGDRREPSAQTPSEGKSAQDE